MLMLLSCFVMLSSVLQKVYLMYASYEYYTTFISFIMNIYLMFVDAGDRLTFVRNHAFISFTNLYIWCMHLRICTTLISIIMNIYISDVCRCLWQGDICQYHAFISFTKNVSLMYAYLRQISWIEQLSHLILTASNLSCGQVRLGFSFDTDWCVTTLNCHNLLSSVL